MEVAAHREKQQPVRADDGGEGREARGAAGLCGAARPEGRRQEERGHGRRGQEAARDSVVGVREGPERGDGRRCDSPAPVDDGGAAQAEGQHDEVHQEGRRGDGAAQHRQDALRRVATVATDAATADAATADAYAAADAAVAPTLLRHGCCLSIAAAAAAAASFASFASFSADASLVLVVDAVMAQQERADAGDDRRDARGDAPELAHAEEVAEDHGDGEEVTGRAWPGSREGSRGSPCARTWP